ncbi:MAG: hypothetical protein ACM31I_09560 [Deltaproteobacteria bacterium]
MGPKKSCMFPRRWTALACAFVPLLLLPATSRSADFSLSSRTYALYYEREVPGAETQKYAPVYEYLAGDARGLGGRPFSFHFYGWGRQDLADDSGTNSRSGDVGSAYLQYLHPRGNAEMRLGRFFLAEGTAAEILDGAFVKLRTGPGLGVSLFGGLPVERTITGTQTGDSIYGGRVFFAAARYLEIGATYLKEDGTFQGDDREVAGGDIWLRPGIPVELSGRATYNLATEDLASQRYVLRLLPVAAIDLAVGYEAYTYKDLFQTALNPAFLAPALDNADEVQTIFGVLGIGLGKGVTVEGGVKSIRHDRDDPGDALRGEGGLRFAFNDRKDVLGLSGAVVSADREENEYQEYRAFASFSPGGWRFTVDGLTHRYKVAINGIKNGYQVVASAGWQAASWFKISGDLTYTKSPRFDEDYAGLIRLALDLGTSTGGTK